MRTKGFIIVISIAAFLASILLPFSFKEEADTFNQTLNISASLIGAIFAVLTFIIAIILFHKYGIDNTFLEKRTDVVFRLLEKINGLSYSIENEKYFFILNLGSSEKKNLEAFYSIKLSFSTDYYNDLEKLFEIANSPFIPRSIIQKMEPIQPPVISFDISEPDKINYAKVYLFGHKKEDTHFGRINNADITLFDFMVSYNEIKEAIVTWIKENTSINTSDLNI